MFVPGAKPKMKTHNSDMDGLAIVIRGNKAAKNVSSGDYVLVENSTISGIADGGYKAAANVSAGTAFTSANLTPLSKGAVTQIGEDVATLNSKIATQDITSSITQSVGKTKVYRSGNMIAISWDINNASIPTGNTTLATGLPVPVAPASTIAGSNPLSILHNAGGSGKAEPNCHFIVNSSGEFSARNNTGETINGTYKGTFLVYMTAT